MDFNNMKVNQAQVEINQMTNEMNKQNKDKKMVEIFTALTQGSDTSKYGKDTDACINTIKTWGEIAQKGNFQQKMQAQAELNSITTLAIEAPLEKRLQLANIVGRETVVGYDEELRVEMYQLQGDRARQQANDGSFLTSTVKKETKTLDTKTITGGISLSPREYASGNINAMGYAMEQTVTTMTNMYVTEQWKTLKDAIANATTMRNYAQGYTKSNIDAMIAKLRKFGGKVTITGDYTAISEINTLAGFDVTPLDTSRNRTQWIYSEAVMDEIMRTGLLSNYNGSPIVEIPNTYDLTKLNEAGDFYDTYLDEDGLLFIPQGQYSPLLIARRGGLQSMEGEDLNTRSHLLRLDVEYGNYVVPSFLPLIGLIDKQ